MRRLPESSAIGGGGEQDDCLLDHVGGHTLDGAQLLHQLCCRCRVVCPIVELADRAHRLGHAGVALRAGGLGEGLVRGIANRLAAELPPATVHFDETELVELVQHLRVEHLAQLSRELLQPGDGAAGAQHGGVLQGLALLGGELIEPRR